LNLYSDTHEAWKISEEDNVRIKLAAIAKNEGIYFAQWIFHHYKFGIKDFEIWINQTSDNSIDILNQINLHPDIRIKIVDADSLYEDCRKSGRNFQYDSYNIIFRSSLAEKFDYLFFLDVDEFWTPKDLTTSLEAYLGRFPNADAISFRWAFDSITEDQAIMQLPADAYKVQLSNHVKTIIKLSEKILEINIHNSIISDGVYILEDGSIFLEEKSRESRSIISETLEGVQLPDYFIFHAAYRSEREYISRLLRGRGHANDSQIIKQNRMGYLPQPESKSMNWDLMQESRHRYFEEYKTFVDKCSLGKFLEETSYIDVEVEKFIELICQKKDLIPKSYQQFRGINFQALSPMFGTTDTIKFAIDLAKYDKDEGLKVVGWSYDWFYPDLEISACIMVNGVISPTLSLLRHERPDVVKAYLDAPSRCGFSLDVPAEECMGLKEFQLILTNGINTIEIEVDTQPKVVPAILNHESYLRGIDLFRDLELANLKNCITTIFDVGANTGQSCTEYLEHWPSAKVYCFEPSPKVFKVLGDRYRHNNQVELLKLGLSDLCTSMTLVEEDISVNNYFIEGVMERKALDMVDCEVVRGDCFTSGNKLPGIDFLKIDTEGHDLRVLRGFKESLNAGIVGLIQCEVSMSMANPKHAYFQEILDFIKPFDFEIFGFYEQIRTPGREFLRRANLVLINYDYFQSRFPKLV